MIACMMKKLKWMESYPHKLCVVASIMTGFSFYFWKCERDSGHKNKIVCLCFIIYLYTTTIISWWIQRWLMVTSPCHSWDCVSNDVKVLTTFFCSIWFCWNWHNNHLPSDVELLLWCHWNRMLQWSVIGTGLFANLVWFWVCNLSD